MEKERREKIDNVRQKRRKTKKKYKVKRENKHE